MREYVIITINHDANKPRPSTRGKFHHLSHASNMVSVNVPTSYDWGEYVLHKAASEGDTTTLQQLLEEGHSPSTTGGTSCWLRGASENHTRTPLHYAAKHGHLDCIRLLLKYGADPNSKDGDGYTPIHYLCQMHNPSQDHHDNLRQCMSSLVLCGADLRAKTNSGRTPLEIAQTQRNSICQRAIEKQCMYMYKNLGHVM